MPNDQTQSESDSTRRAERRRTTPNEPDEPDGPNEPDELDELTRRRFVQSTAAAGTSAIALGRTRRAAGRRRVQESCDAAAETYEVGDDGGEWLLLNETWGMDGAEQCIWVNDDGSYGYDFSAADSGISYPEVYCGARPWGFGTGIPELPARRGDVEEFVLEWDADVDVTGGEWNFGAKWYLIDGEPGEQPDFENEIRLVFDWGGGYDHPLEAENVWTDEFGNVIDYWEYDAGPGGTDATSHVFRIRGGATRGRVDLTEVVEFVDERHGPSDDLTLTGVEVGSEYWADAEGEVRFDALNLVVNGSVYTSGPEGRIGESDCPEAAGGSELLDDGSTVCDLDGDGQYRDVNGDGAVSNGDVTDFFSNQHVDPWDSRTDLFDFDGDGDVGQGDVVELFSYIN